jgi:hypothetical protein
LSGAPDKEGDNLGTGKEIRVPHPGMEEENLGIVLSEGGSIHVVENTDLTKDLLDPLGRPGMKQKPLNANFDVIESVESVKIRLQKRSNVIIALGVCNQTELYQELEID